MGTFGRRESKIGLAPGTLVHVGEKKAEKVVIRVLAYNSEKLIEKKAGDVLRNVWRLRTSPISIYG